MLLKSFLIFTISFFVSLSQAERRVPVFENSLDQEVVEKLGKTSIQSHELIKTDKNSSVDLLQTIAELKSEIKRLNTIVTDHQDALEVIRSVQDERYADYESRLLNLSKQLKEGSDNEPSLNLSEELALNDVNSVGQKTEVSQESSDKLSYQKAISALKKREYESSMQLFHLFIEQYPESQLVANAFYWLGELYLLEEPSNLEKSRQSFVQVLHLYPEHSKIPDVLFKLSVVYERLGNLRKSKEYRDQLMANYPDTSAARLLSLNAP